MININKFTEDKLSLYRKNDFDEGSKILLDYQNNFVGILKIVNNTAKNFDILTTSSSVLPNYFDSSTKLLFCIQLKF